MVSSPGPQAEKAATLTAQLSAITIRVKWNPDLVLVRNGVEDKSSKGHMFTASMEVGMAEDSTLHFPLDDRLPLPLVEQIAASMRDTAKELNEMADAIDRTQHPEALRPREWQPDEATRREMKL